MGSTKLEEAIKEFQEAAESNAAPPCVSEVAGDSRVPLRLGFTLT